MKKLIFVFAVLFTTTSIYATATAGGEVDTTCEKISSAKGVNGSDIQANGDDKKAVTGQ